MSKYFIISLLSVLWFTSSSGHSDATSTSTTPASTAVKFTSVTGYAVSSARDGLAKRGVQVKDLAESAASAKSYEPPPEFYRGPGSTGASSASNSYNKRDNPAANLSAKPIAFPDTNERSNYRQDNKYLGTSYDSWKQQLKGGNVGAARQPVLDRISVGHHGSAGYRAGGDSYGGGGNYDGSGSYSGSSNYGSSGGYGGSGSYGGSGGGNTGAYNNVHAYEARPYATGPGGSGSGGGHSIIEYSPQPTHYAATAHGGGGGGEGVRGGGGGGGAGNVYYSNSDGIPFELYSNNNNNKGHYAGHGGEYSYTQYPVNEPPEHATHKGHPDLPQKSLLVKSFLIPLASAAVLGIAAALLSNPLLLQLGTVSGVAPALVGKRKRRAVNEVELMPRSLREDDRLLAYRAHHDRELL